MTNEDHIPVAADADAVADASVSAAVIANAVASGVLAAGADVFAADADGAAADATALASASAASSASSASAAASASAPTPADADAAYMALALEQARRAAALGEVPIGAVVVYEPIDRATRRALAEPRVIAQACNLRETTNDPAGHAEFLALEEAARVLETWRLVDCTVYVTLEPCVMCAGLMHQARVRRCVYGASDQKAGALGTLYSIHEDSRLNHQFSVTSGILHKECVGLLREFFACRRKKGKSAQGAQGDICAEEGGAGGAAV